MKWVNCLLAGMLAVAGGGVSAFTGVQEQVANVERAFAATMKARDHAAFVAFLSDEAVFSGRAESLRGKQAVADEWRKFFVKPEAPFSWEPDEVEVLASGMLAKTSGPVHGPDGKLIARFNSVWRLEAPGVWRIVFDGGAEVCGGK